MDSSLPRKIKAVAFHLPQFHPVPENDAWWEPGFTEWHNVTRARPRFPGHYQPQLPADLGFYDLRLAEARAAQADLARRYGLDGFCYYHYWFEGRRLLHEPVDRILASREPDFPFCLCWANETWSRTWDGRDTAVLIKQTYSEADNERHIAWLLQVFRDPRYIRIDGKPCLAIYRLGSIPGARMLIEHWNRAAIEQGFLGIYWVAMRTGFRECDDSFPEDAVDCVVDFQPNRDDFPVPSNWSGALYEGLRRMLPDAVYQALKSRGSAIKRISYTQLAEAKIAELGSGSLDRRYAPCVFPSWDNTPRRKTPTVIQNLDAERYEQWLRAAADFAAAPGRNGLVFINAWNEWAEGCHLEPDQRFGHAFLHATARGLGTAVR